jgi:hypothetical protein
MKLCSLLFSLLLPLFSFAQLKECGLSKLTFEINKSPQKDTLDDLILTSNSYSVVRGMDNIFFINKNLSTINYSIEGAQHCYYRNDTVLVIRPIAHEWKFNYTHNGKTFTKVYTTSLRTRPELKAKFDGIVPFRDSIFNFQNIDSLSFTLELWEFQKWYPKENFDFTISDFKIFLVRKKPSAQKSKLIIERKFNPGKSFSIKDILKKAKPGDRLVVEYQPISIERTGEILEMGCVVLRYYKLGKAE